MPLTVLEKKRYLVKKTHSNIYIFRVISKYFVTMETFLRDTDEAFNILASVTTEVCYTVEWITYKG